MHHFHPSILRKYDIRGLVNETLTAEDMHAAGQCFGLLARKNGVITLAVCRDGRLSSLDFEEALVAGIISVGINVVKLGMGPTPLLYYAVKSQKDIGGGAMITGSHNDERYNGLKMMLDTRPIWGDEIQAFQTQIHTFTPQDFSKTGTVSERDIQTDYVQRITRDMVIDSSLKVVWDCGNGVAGTLIQQLVNCLPGTHILLHDQVDGTFPNHHPDPTVEANMDDLKKAMQEHHADIGIGFDGDGDRIGVIAHDGQMIYGDQLMTIYGRDLLKRHPGATLLLDVKTSAFIVNDLRRLGGNPQLCATGHSSIKSMMQETGALLAGELSGHMFFADDYYGYDDALYAAVRLLNILSREKKTIPELLEGLPAVYKTGEIRIPCDDAEKFQVMERITESLKDTTGLLTIDGVRVETNNGWWLLRASNTESMLIVRAEALSKEGLEKLMGEVQGLLDQEGLRL
jgi:phosphomannomutase